MNYKIIGNDGKTYGPASVEQMQIWIAQNRVESRTPVFVEGANDWTFAGLLPEFAAKFNPTPGVIAPTQTAAEPNKTNACALWSLICGILAWLSCCCCVPVNLIGLVLGIIALTQISTRAGNENNRTMAILGIVLSAASLLCGFGWMIFSLVKDPSSFQFHFNQN